VDDVTLRVDRGETVVLIGPSGCGKSTLLRSVLGLVWPDTGIIEVDGRRLQQDSVQAIRRATGYVIQQGGLFPHLTARANATLMARELGWSQSRIEQRVMSLCETVRFPSENLDKYPGQLSGGQCQRVSLMRALFLGPEVLLMDEPLGALDPIIRSGLQDELAGLFAELEKTVLFVTHDMYEAAFFADRMALMRQGEIVQAGEPEEIANHPEEPFVEEFIRAQRRDLDALLADRKAALESGERR
jgi:osmoprotectant transport system ATP-binding protein